MNDEHKPAPKPDEIRRAKAGHVGKTEVVHYPPKPKPQQPRRQPPGDTKKYEPKPSLLRAVRELKRLEETLEAIGQPTHSLNPFRAQLQAAMEAIPINWENAAKRAVMGFVLLAGEWCPVHNFGDCNPASIFAGGIFWGIRHEDGSTSQGPSQKYEWAHCTADNTVNYHWLDQTEEPVTGQAETFAILNEAAKVAKGMDRYTALKGIRDVCGLNVSDEPDDQPADYSHVPEG